MAFTCGFYNSIGHDRTYNAVQMSQIFDGIINDGVYMGFMDYFMVTPVAGMTVQVGAGRAWFNHTWSYNDSPYMVRLSESSVGFNRIDAVCLVIDISDEVRANSIEVVEGDPVAGTPEKPELVDTDTKYYHPLAYITIGSEVESITSADIENAVGTSATPFVTGIIETVEVDELVAQWEAQWEAWTSEHQSEYTTWIDDQETAFMDWVTDQKAAYIDWIQTTESEFTSWISDSEDAFDAWFETIKGKLDGDVAAHLQNEIDDINSDMVSFKEEVQSNIDNFEEEVNASTFERYHDLCNRNTTFERNGLGEIVRYTSSGPNNLTSITEINDNVTVITITDGEYRYIKTNTYDYETDTLSETYEKEVIEV